MIEGEINADRVAFVPIRVISRRGEYFDKRALLDTGFSGALALPPDQIRELELDFAEERTVVIMALSAGMDRLSAQSPGA